MEIERKFTLKSLPDNLESYPSHHIEQVYLNYNPVVRARKQDDEYYLTYKGSGMMARDESNLPLNEESYYHLREKADGSVISKRRYLIPLEHPGFNEGFPTPPADYSLTIELDVFDVPFAPLIMAEVSLEVKKQQRLSSLPHGLTKMSPTARNTTIPIWLWSCITLRKIPKM